MALLTVASLRTVFHTETGEVAAVDDVSFALDAGEVLGIVGESGQRQERDRALAPRARRLSPASVAAGSAHQFEGATWCRPASGRCAACAGATISMIFQEPMTSLNPVITVGDQIVEALIAAPAASRARGAGASARGCSRRVGIPDAERRSTPIRTSSPAACGSA